MSWSRKGDFFKAKAGLVSWQKEPGEFPDFDERHVSFYNEGLSATINKIDVKYVYHEKNPTSGYFTIKLSPCIFKQEKFQHVFKNIFPNEIIDGESVTIQLTPETLVKLNKLFDELNKDFNREEFDTQIRKELDNLLYFKSHILHSHIIKEKSTNLINTSKSVINPDKKPSVDLNNLIGTLYYNKKDLLKNLKKLLVKGADPTDPKMFINALLQHELDVFKLILRYTGINYTRRRQDQFWERAYESPVEIARRFDKPEQFKLMTAAKIPKNLLSTCDRKKLLINNCIIAKDDHELITRFDFNNNKSIITHLIPVSEFYHTRYKETFHEVLNLFANTFEDPDGNIKKVVDTFYEDFAPNKRKWVEIICEKEGKNKKVIGCNLFETLNLKNDNEHLVFSPIYSFIRPEFRGYKLMSLLAFRLPFVLQRMAPDKKVAIYYSALSSSSSIDMAKDFAHFPVLQPDHITKLLNDIFKEYYGNDFKYHHDGTMAFYFKEPNALKVKQQGAESKGDSFNQQEIFGSQTNVAAPVFFYITDDSTKAFSLKLKEIGIDLESHIQSMQPALEKLMPEFNSNQPCKSLPHGQALFWKNKLQPSKEVTCGLRCKL